MLNDTDFQNALQEQLHWHKARITFVVAFTLALFKVTTVNLTRIANAFAGKANKASTYRRIQRFFAHFDFDHAAWARLVLKLLPIKGDFVLSIDRTNWRFGSQDINILMAGIVYKGTAYPLLWMLLPKKGNSNTKERAELITSLLRLIPASLIRAVVADREFIGKAWFKTFDDEGLPYYIRIRENARVHYRGRSKSAKILFRDLGPGQARVLRKRRQIYGHWLYVAALRLQPDQRDQYLIVVSNTSAHAALSMYRLRWGIEVLFSSLKKRGFDFERTHMVDPARIKKLTALLALAFTWAHLVGQWLSEQEPLVMKNHGYRARSIFRSGLDHLQHVLLNLVDKRRAFADCLWVLIWPLLSPQITTP